MSKMGRPKLPNNEIRDQIVMLRLTRREKADLRRKHSSKKPLAELIRRRCFPTTTPSK